MDGGVVRCWGPRGEFSRRPVVALDDAIEIASGMFVSCAIRRDHSVTCWEPVLTDAKRWSVGVSDAVGVSVGYGKGCAVTAAGQVRCWDATMRWPIEDVTATPVSGLADVTAVAVGMVHACALRTDGSVWCWGSNESGGLGHRSLLVGDQPPQPVANVAGAREIAVGTYYSCARLGDDTVRCWGSFGVRDKSPEPFPVLGWTSAVQLSLNAGCNAGTLACARFRDGSVRCLGDNDAGQVGDGTKNVRNDPVLVRDLSNAVDLAVGCSHACALRAGGQVVCWGDGELLGYGRGQDQLSPAPVPDL
jgi:alpha-tubulin suppressor-like RCC1 family protein